MTPLRVALTIAVSAAALPATSGSAAAQPQESTEARLRRIEGELRAVQRKVFPDGVGKTFSPEIAAPAGPAPQTAGLPATSAVTDLLSRMDAVEAQLQRLTGQSEESQNRLAKIEARLTALEPAPAPSQAVAETIAAAPAAQAAPPMGAPAAAAADKPAPAAAKPAAGPTPATPAPATPAKVAEPPTDRVAAVRAIQKPSSDDKGEDEYSYGYRLWEAKFYPEAQQQLQRFVQAYPKHKRISYARNLLGRAYLDDAKPGTAAQWFLQNYQTDKAGERAADSLLYLGVAMTRLKETKRACVAFAEFRSAYPAEAEGRLKGQYDAATKGVTCS